MNRNIILLTFNTTQNIYSLVSTCQRINVAQYLTETLKFLQQRRAVYRVIVKTRLSLCLLKGFKATSLKAFTLAGCITQSTNQSFRQFAESLNTAVALIFNAHFVIII